jgi:three-Cys-motif partner protein
MSNSKSIRWSSNGRIIPQLEPHTKAKHQLLEEYIKNWIIILCANHGWKETTVTLVDGFCGGGIYRDDNNHLWEGSPIRMIKMIEEGHRIVQEERSKPYHKLNVKFIFIEKEKEHIECLRKQIIEHGFGQYLESGQCILICKEFISAVDDCINFAKKGHSFFFLDPFGIDDIDMDSVRKIIALKRSEILWSYMIHSLTRILPNINNNYRIIQEILEAGEYYQEIPNNKDMIVRQQYLKNQSMLLIREKSQVKFIYPFALMKNKQSVLYYLVHLANDPKAIEVMKKYIWQYNNLEYRYHYNIFGSGFRTIDYYENNLKLYDIEEVNLNHCLTEISDKLLTIINSTPEDIVVDDLYNYHILEQSPGTLDHLVKSLNQLRDGGEIEIIKPDNKIFKGNNIDKRYRIRQCQLKQLTFFDLNSFIE